MFLCDWCVLCVQIVLQGQEGRSQRVQHIGEKAFRCEHEGCGKLYTTAHHLKVKLYDCLECGKIKTRTVVRSVLFNIFIGVLINYLIITVMCHLFLLKRYMNDHILGINLTYVIIWDVEKSLQQVLYCIQTHFNVLLFCTVSHTDFMLTNRIWPKKSRSNTHW